MKFNHFRLVVVVVGCFSGFFAYLCRLNLSLIIEEISIKDNVLPPSERKGDYVREELAHMASEVKAANEEYTLSLLSPRSNLRLMGDANYFAQLGKLKATNATRKQQALKSTKRKIEQPTLVHPLTIDVSSSSDNNNNKDQPEIIGPQPNAGISDDPNNPEPEQNDDEISRKPEIELLNWDKEKRNDLLGAFFFGYVIAQIPCGRAAEIFGPKVMFLFFGLGTGLASLAFPFAAKYSDAHWFAYAIRFFIGISQGGLFPTAYVLICNWLPARERAKWLAVPASMTRLGTIAMNFLVPIVMLNYGWELIFYLSGAATLCWSLALLIFGSDRPSSSSWISGTERRYIESKMEDKSISFEADTKSAVGSPATPCGSTFSINEPAAAPAGPAKSKFKSPPINWLKLPTNRPLMLVTLVMFTAEWSNLILLIKLPGFLGPALNMSLVEISKYNIWLMVVYCVHYPLSGYLAGRIDSAAWFERSVSVRKLFEGAAHLMQCSACLLILSTREQWAVLASLFLMMLGRATVGGGSCLMPPELSREYPGTVMAFANSIANLAGFAGPKILTWLVADPSDYDSWRPFWIVSSVIFALGGATFCLFADNRPQNFARRRRPKSAISQVQLVMS